MDTLLEERIYSKAHNINNRLQNNKRWNFENNQSVTAANTSLSLAQMEKAGLASVIQLAKGTGALTSEQILEYRVTEECLSMFNVDGSSRHTTKSKLLGFFNM